MKANVFISRIDGLAIALGVGGAILVGLSATGAVHGDARDKTSARSATAGGAKHPPGRATSSDTVGSANSSARPDRVHPAVGGWVDRRTRPRRHQR